MNLKEAFKNLNLIIHDVENGYTTPERAAERAQWLKREAVNAGLLSFNPPVTVEDYRSLQATPDYESSASYL